MRILVCGGRDYNDYQRVADILPTYSANYTEGERGVYPDLVIIQGGARGADACAKAWAASNHVVCINFPADWKQYGRASGPIRNKQMLEEGRPDIVVAFPGGRGTENMIELAKKASVRVDKYE